MKKYTSYERILTALRHKEADRVPFDLGATVLTGMNVNAYKNLRKYLGLPEKDVEIHDIIQQLARVDDDVLDVLKVDVRILDPKPPTNNPRAIAPYLTDNGQYYHMTDELGIVWRMPALNGHYFDMLEHPFEHFTETEEVEGYEIPAGDDPGRFIGMKENADYYVNELEKAYVLGRNAAGVWELSLWASGFEKFFVDMMMDKSLAHAVMRKFTDYKMAYWEKALKTVGSNVLIISEADDLATQNSLLCSIELYKELVHPYHKELFSFIKETARKNGAEETYLFYHTCGAMRPFAELLKEEGVDILNPVQVSASGMDTKQLKKEIGDMFTFWGGGADTQYVLPSGSVQEVRDEVKRRIDDLAPGGGFVFAGIHNIQADVSPENFMAMWETLQEYGVY